MKTIIDTSNWNRKEHFQFFKSFDDPFLGITTTINITQAYKEAKEKGESFFLHSLHKVMKGVNATKEFHYRIEHGLLVSYDIIHVSATIGRTDGTFGFSFIEYSPDRDKFIAAAKVEIERVKNGTGLMISPNFDRLDVIHFSAVPWFSFTDLKHASSFTGKDSTPKISTGKCIKEGDDIKLPISITAHHALMDGFHVGHLFEQIEQA